MGALTGLLNRARPLSIPLLRVVLGLTMFWHGVKKFDDGIDGFEGFLDFLSIPLPGFFAYVVALLEVIGGVAIVLGLATRIVALAFVVELLVAVFRFKYGEDVGFIGAEGAGAELDWALIAGFVVVAAQGPGALSADHMLKLEPSASATAV